MTSNKSDSSTDSPPAGKITVLCVDDSVDVVSALRALIEGEKGMTALQGTHDTAEFVRLAPELKPHVAIVDLTMPGPLTPIEAIRTVVEAAPEIRILAYSGYDDPDTVNDVMEAGAWGFVSKHAELSAVIQAVRRVAAGEVVF